MIPSQVLLPKDGWRLLPESAAVAIIVTDQDRVLMQHRDRIDGVIFPGFWGLFGGAIDPGESPIDALRRELYEELRFTAGDAKYFTAVDYDFEFCGKGWTRRRYFVIHVVESDIATMELHEGDDMRTFALPEILERIDVIPFDAWALWMYANRTALSE